MSESKPTYALEDVIAHVQRGRYRSTASAQHGAGNLGFDESDICACICALTLADFAKTMEAIQRPGLWQDVYKPRYDGHLLYVKVQVVTDDSGETVVVISFKRL